MEGRRGKVVFRIPTYRLLLPATSWLLYAKQAWVILDSLEIEYTSAISR